MPQEGQCKERNLRWVPRALTGVTGAAKLRGMFQSPRLPMLLFALAVALGATRQPAEGSAPPLASGDVLWNLEQQLRGRRDTLRDRSDRHLYLSETTTLAMELALLRGDRDAYLRERTVLEERFLSPVGLLRWQLGRTKDGWCSNASVDDLRAVRSLLGAYDRWGDEDDARLGLRIGRAVLDHNVRDGALVDAASWTCGRRAADPPELGQPAGTLTLAFADLEALRLLGLYEPKANGVLYRTRAVVLAGTLHASGPQGRYLVASRSYDPGSGNPIERELQRVYLLEGQVRDSMGRATALEVCAQEDQGWRGSDNIAHVATAARRLARCGLEVQAAEALARLSAFELEEGPHAGLLGYRHSDNDTVVWTFDVLLALIAVEEAASDPAP